MPLLFKLTFRYILGGRAATRFVTAIAFFGVFIATTAFLITVGVMNGFEKVVKENILSTTPHLIVFAGDRKKAQRVTSFLKRDLQVEKVYWFSTFGVILQRGGYLTGAVLFGIPRGEERFFFPKKGIWFEGNLTERGIALGNLLSSRLGIYGVPQEVTAISPTAMRTPIGFVPRIRKLEVVALYRSGKYELDTAGVGYYRFLSGFLKPTSFQVAVFLKDPYGAKELKGKLEREFPDLFITTWVESNRDFFDALRLQKLGMALVVGLITLVATFNITALLMTKIRELSKDFAVMRAFGADRGFVFKLVLLLGLTLAALGAIGGIAVASLAAAVINEYKLIRVPEDIYTSPYLPVVFGWKEVALVFAFTLILAFVASLIPAKVATSERVTEILRNN